MPRKEVIPIIYAIDGKSFPKPPSTCEHTVTQVVTKANRTVGKGALLNKELLAEKEKISAWLKARVGAKKLRLITE